MKPPSALNLVRPSSAGVLTFHGHFIETTSALVAQGFVYST